MDQRSDDLRQNIESTRASLEDKLDSLENKARETFDLKHQVSERPWMALGAAVAAGFVLGSLGGGEEQRWQGQPAVTTDYNQHAYTQTNTSNTQHPQSQSATDSFMSQFDDEIEMLKGAAVSALSSFLRDSLRSYIPAISDYLPENSRPGYTRTPSTAANTSYRSGTGAGFDSPPASRGQSSQLSNTEAGSSGSYYPPGSQGAEQREYATTYPPTSEADRERVVGEDKNYWREA